MPKPASFEVAISAAERELDRLAGGLDVPLGGKTGPCVVVLAIARQAAEVYRAIRREATADGLGITAPILLRSLVDAAILVRWIGVSPALRVAMYMAEADRHRLAAAEPFRQFRSRRGSGKGPVYTRAQIADLKGAIRATRARAKAASEPIGEKGALLPSTEAMARSTGDTAMWEAYEVIYRVASPWTHLSGWSLAHHRIEERPDGHHIEIDGAFKGQALRALAAPSMAHLLGSSSRICGLGIEREARLWQDAVVSWPAPILDSGRPPLARLER